MSKQLIITVGREYGSGGRAIAKKIAEALDLPLYDKNTMANALGDDLSAYDEKASNPFLTRHVRGHSNSMEEILAERQFAFLKEKAAEGASFVVVGRCAEYVLRDNPNVISIFVLGDYNIKLQRIMDIYKVSKEEAKRTIDSTDNSRRKYHNKYSDVKWGDSRGYGLCINSSHLGVDKTADVILNYIKAMTE